MNQPDHTAQTKHIAAPLTVSITDSGAHLKQSRNGQVGYILMQVKPSKTANIKTKSPLNLSVVLDRSTSMSGERLHKLKAAAHHLLDKLSPNDWFSVISYSDRAEVVVPAGPIRDKSQIIAQISSIQASGGTEILQGLTAGIREITKAPSSEFVSHLILLTDGHTYGDDRDCIALAKRAAERGIGLSAFGLGSEWNDFFLDELVSPSGGQSGYIEEPEHIIHLLRQRISGLGALFAQNIRLQLSIPRDVHIKEAFKVTPFAQPIDIHRNTINLGTIEGRTPLTLLLELQFDQIEEDTLTFPFSLRADLPGETPPTIMLTNQYKVQVNRAKKKLPKKLMEAVRLLNLNRMNDRAWEDAQSGDVLAATKRMTYLTKRLDEAGLSDLAMTAKAQTMQLSENGTLGKTSRIAIKYGTRVKLTQQLTTLFEAGDDLDDETSDDDEVGFFG